MRFDVNRLSQLAGIDKGSNRLISEAGNRSHHDDRVGDENDHRWGKNQLNEERPSGKDYLDAPGDDEEGDPRLGYTREGTKKGGRRKGAGKAGKRLAYDEGTKKGDRRDDAEKAGERLAFDEGAIDELNDAYFLGEEEQLDVDVSVDEEDVDVSIEDGADIVLEIDEGMLMREIRKMKSQRVNEAKLRSAVRNEIRGIFEDLGISDSSWVYGENPPKNSKQGRVNLSFTGPGFW